VDMVPLNMIVILLVPDLGHKVLWVQALSHSFEHTKHFEFLYLQEKKMQIKFNDFICRLIYLYILIFWYKYIFFKNICINLIFFFVIIIKASNTLVVTDLILSLNCSKTIFTVTIGIRYNGTI